ncbi:helix-turn-helix transcriptional regulator [Halorussus sp. MSC15.2]|uniref:helix-turn-helix transcriptional regulator n=1 Tax=Halorussus sp. MSC15.2 TaxID=2283638 RepID=UPI0013D796D1|nr:helix-turn-helix transcriptional regulator [Halorussus sp. MSC15.2]NEU59195.1 PadR family transcriptional regulator [Halorussus sp. MSC15.2]
MSADTPTSVENLRAFERDLLFAIRALERDDSPPKGLTIKQRLEAGPYEDVNHSRLYQNLDSLAADNYIQKRERDGRTNEYATTERTRALLEAFACRRARQTGVELEADANAETESAPNQIGPDHADASEQTESAPDQTDANMSEQEGES